MDWGWGLDHTEDDAFILYDKSNNEIFIARDTYGIRPLFIGISNDTFIFSSPFSLRELEYSQNGTTDVQIIKSKDQPITFYLYPNPTLNELMIVSDHLTLNNIEIMNINGKTLKHISKNVNTISVADLPTGIYFIKVITD